MRKPDFIAGCVKEIMCKLLLMGCTQEEIIVACRSAADMQMNSILINEQLASIRRNLDSVWQKKPEIKPEETVH